MISVADLRRLARARLKDAQALSAAKRYDGAVYMVGYAVEIVLKARIAQTLRWKDFPVKETEFKGLASFKIHKLSMLLRLSGREDLVTTKYMTDWSAVAAWDPETRYRPIGSASKLDADSMIASATTLLKVL